MAGLTLGSNDRLDMVIKGNLVDLLGRRFLFFSLQEVALTGDQCQYQGSPFN